jgi:hypothetical protein
MIVPAGRDRRRRAVSSPAEDARVG